MSTDKNTHGDERARERVRARYATATEQATTGARPSCADSDPAGMCAKAYDPAQLAYASAAAATASLGCGNPPRGRGARR